MCLFTISISISINVLCVYNHITNYTSFRNRYRYFLYHQRYSDKARGLYTSHQPLANAALQ